MMKVIRHETGHVSHHRAVKELLQWFVQFIVFLALLAGTIYCMASR